MRFSFFYRINNAEDFSNGNFFIIVIPKYKKIFQAIYEM